MQRRLRCNCPADIGGFASTLVVLRPGSAPTLSPLPDNASGCTLVRCRVVAVTGKQRLSKHGCDLIVHAAFSSTSDHDISCAAHATVNEAEPAVNRTIAHVLNTTFLRSDPGGTPLMSRMCIPPLGKAMESRTARLH